VGFRHFVVREARRHGVDGRVRNLPDGAVEAEGEGARERLELWVHDIRGGPPHANVTAIRVDWSDEPTRWRGFHAE
jgi:acylphosphatase